MTEVQLDGTGDVKYLNGEAEFAQNPVPVAPQVPGVCL